ncbi:hypothetical protein KUO17_07845 [Pseudomonas sp. MAFF 301350]|uniref:Integrase n=1 Tax=Pseudomonas aegrilactucae TaxID=2854028 RepID=A0A9Q2XIU3_9PSED|nr:hypothetical protein [Pseudomonas aegrilactucae]
MWAHTFEQRSAVTYSRTNSSVSLHARGEARTKYQLKKMTHLANRIAQFQFRDIRPKADSGIKHLSDASLLLGHSKEGITERIYRRIGAIAKPSK